MIALLIALAAGQDTTDCVALMDRDLNCNGTEAVDEPPIDTTDPTCAQVVALFPEAITQDYYYDYASFGCLFPVTDLDADEDGFGGGNITINNENGLPERVTNFTCDDCPDDFNPNQEDVDCDGFGDICDNCPELSNPQQADFDQDGIGDDCDLCPRIPSTNIDTDLDGLGDECDNCPERANPLQADTDQDTFGDVCDTCPVFVNPDQADADGDRKGDICDNCVDIPNFDQNDADGDLRGDVCDECPNFYTRAPAPDTDGDGIGDPCDDGLTVHGGGKSLSCDSGAAGAGWFGLVLLGGLLRRRR